VPPLERRYASPIGELVDRRIKELGLSGFQEFTEHAGIPYSTLYNIARGKKLPGGAYTYNRPSVDTRAPLAAALTIRADELDYLFTVVSDDRDSPRPDSPLYTDLETAMLEHRFTIGEDIAAFGRMNKIVPEVLEAVYYGGRDAEGRLVHPPVGTLEDIADVLGKSRTSLMRRYLARTDTNPMFFTEADLAKPGATKQRNGWAGAHAIEAPSGQPPMRPLPVRIAGWVGAGPDQDEEEHLDPVWVEEQFARGKELLAFKIRGDSMEGGRRPIFDGDLVLVNRKDMGYDGAAVVARLRSDGYVCKLLKVDKFGKNLVSANPTYTNGTPPYIPAEQVAEVVGRVIEIRHQEVDGG
jgi:phage repressor protein C with HTH and peptisase S24 domain/transcriptional regulator with XRE-family HTH domain